MKNFTYLLGFVLVLLSNSATATDDDNKPLAVTTSTLSSLLIKTTHSAPASVISLNHTTLSAQINGLALKVRAEAGDRIKKGKLLVEIDCRDYDIAYQQATAALNATSVNIEHTKKQFQRNQRLFNSRTIPREMYEQTETAYLSAKASIEPQRYTQKSAELSQTRCKIYAPFDGQITERMVQKGQLLTAGTPLFKLLQTKSIEVKAELSATEVMDAKKSPDLKFMVGDKEYSTEVRAVIQQINTSTRTQEVRLRLKNASELAIGLSGRLQWKDQTGQLPPEYIMRREGTLGVMIIKDKKAHFQALPNAIEGQPAHTFLSGSTQIIEKNRYRAKQGQEVSIENVELVK